MKDFSEKTLSSKFIAKLLQESQFGNLIFSILRWFVVPGQFREKINNFRFFLSIIYGLVF